MKKISNKLSSLMSAPSPFFSQTPLPRFSYNLSFFITKKSSKKKKERKYLGSRYMLQDEVYVDAAKLMELSNRIQ